MHTQETIIKCLLRKSTKPQLASLPTTFKVFYFFSGKCSILERKKKKDEFTEETLQWSSFVCLAWFLAGAVGVSAEKALHSVINEHNSGECWWWRKGVLLWFNGCLNLGTARLTDIPADIHSITLKVVLLSACFRTPALCQPLIFFQPYCHWTFKEPCLECQVNRCAFDPIH